MMLRYQHIARVALFLLPLIVHTLPASAKDPNAPPPPDPLRWLMTAEEMRNAGLALRIISRDNIGDFGATVSSYPNKCYFAPDYELAVSGKKLAYFQARGFSLETLCLAITSPVHYNPETGRPIPVAVPALLDRSGSRKPIQAHKLFMFGLSPPDCFRNGAPFLDCNMTYDELWGFKLSAADEQSSRAFAVKSDQWIRKVIGGYGRECTCDEIDISSGAYEGSVSIKGECRLDTFPACLRDRVRGQNPIGALVVEFPDGYTMDKRYNFSGALGTRYGAVEISSRLAHGYAYRIGYPEGDDDMPDVLPPPRIRTGGDE
jgi:hypothetical protein